MINLVETAAEQGATLVNYVRVVAITKGADGFIDGVVAADRETGQQWTITARVVVNATGAFSDSVRRLAEPDAQTLIAPRQGIHLRGGTADGGRAWLGCIAASGRSSRIRGAGKGVPNLGEHCPATVRRGDQSPSTRSMRRSGTSQITAASA